MADAGSAGGSAGDAGPRDGGQADGGAVVNDAGTPLVFLNRVVPGARLRALVVRAPNGEIIGRQSALFDALTQEGCDVRETVDAGLRCVPARGLARGAAVFLDPTCETPVAFDSAPTCTGRRYLGVHLQGSSCGPATFFEMGALIAAGTPLFTSSLPGTCTPAGAVAAQDTWVRLIPSAPSSFAPVQQAPRRALSSTWAVDGLQSPDGMSATTALVDRATGWECEATGTFDAGTRCGPTALSRYSSNFFADAQCGQPAILSTRGCQREPYAPRVTACSSAIRHYAVAAPLSSAWQRAGAACTPSTASTLEYAAVGAEIPPASFPAIVELTIGSGRLKAMGFQIEDAGLWATKFYDSALGHVCSIDVGGDGKKRCVPSAAFGLLNGSFFADPACSEPVLLGGSGCGFDAGYALELDRSFCEPRLRFFVVEQPFDAGAYASVRLADGGSTCALQPPQNAYRMRAVDPTEFPEVRIEPQE